jgi:hypothetical protein
MCLELTLRSRASKSTWQKCHEKSGGDLHDVRLRFELMSCD